MSDDHNVEFKCECCGDWADSKTGCDCSKAESDQATTDHTAGSAQLVYIHGLQKLKPRLD